MGWCLYAARMMFMIIILRIIRSDTTSVWQSIAINRLKLDAAGKKKLSQIYLTMFNVPRYILNLASGAVICMHTLTIDGQGEETGFDLVKDFTALVIILEIDNVVSSIFIQSLDLNLDSSLLPIEEFWKMYKAKDEKDEGWLIRVCLHLGTVIIVLGALFIFLICVNFIILVMQYTWVNLYCDSNSLPPLGS